MNYIEEYKKEYWSDLALDWEFTCQTMSGIMSRCPGRAQEIKKVFDSIEDQTLLITYIKDKGYFCMEWMGGNRDTSLKLMNLESRTMNHCYLCGEDGYGEGYSSAKCNKCKGM